MAKVFEEIDESLAAFIGAQAMYFVATAPNEGHVNVSPKGLDSFRILGPSRVAYLDLGGSGIETLAHVKENGRICLMFCAFSGAARILRLHGTARAVEPHEADFPALRARFPDFPKCRAILDVVVTRIADSCGWGVRGRTARLMREPPAAAEPRNGLPPSRKRP